MAVTYIKKISFAFTLLLLVAALTGLLSACSLWGAVEVGLILEEGDLVINEVVSSNTKSLSVPQLGSPDWVEITNKSDNDINLEGYILRNSSKPSAYYVFPDITIQAGEYLVVYACPKPKGEAIRALCTGYNLPKDGVGLVLYDSGLRVIDEIEVPALDTDISWARTEEGFKYCLTPTPESANAGPMADAPDELEPVTEELPSGVRLNEATAEWVEVYNGSGEVVNLSSYYLSDDAANLVKWRFPDAAMEPGAYIVVGLNNDIGDYKASFRISNTEEAVYFSTESNLIDSLIVNNLYDNLSVGLDASDNLAYFPDLTPGERNSEVYFYSLKPSPMTDANPVRISEVLLKNAYSIVDEFGDRSPWVELHNDSDNPVDLSYFYLSDNPNNLQKWRLPERQLAPGEYLVIFLSGQAAELHTDFRVSAEEPVILLDLTSNHMQVIDIPTESRLDNISYGEQDGTWLYFGQPTPNSENTAHGSPNMAAVERLDRSGVWINEVSAVSMARASAYGVDGRDWIELYNGGDVEIDLAGWYLGKDLDDPYRSELSGSIAPKSYKIIYASSSATGSKDTIPMNISMSGDTLVLSNPSREVVDVFCTGALRYGVTSGRAPGDYTGDRYFFTSATPKTTNSQPIKTHSTAPVFSHQGGFYTDGFTLGISGESIRYTTDGSTPNRSSKIYTGPIAINNNTVVTAISMVADKITSDKVVATFLFEQPHTMPVVCITANPSDYAAVYAQTNKFDPILERAAYIEYYEPSGRLGTSFPAGIRLAGASTRMNMRQKSFNIYLRGGYGQSSVTYPFFEDYPITEFESLTLRNGGQDNFDVMSTLMTDTYNSMLAKRFITDYAESRYAILYVNGAYRGVYQLKENQNEDMLASRYGLDTDDINVIRRNTKELHGKNTQFLWAQAYARNYNLNHTSNYEEFSERVDLDAFIDHIFLETYMGNADTFNQKYWATEDYSVKIRPLIFDLDYGYYGTNIIHHYFSGEGMPTPDGTHTNMWIPTGLKNSNAWRERLYERWAEHLTTTMDGRLELFDSLYSQLEPEMQRHCNYWQVYSYAKWQANVDGLRRRIEGRNDVFKRQMQSYFGLSNAKMEELFTAD